MIKSYDNNLYFPTPLQKMVVEYARYPVYKFELVKYHNNYRIKFTSELSFSILSDTSNPIEDYLDVIQNILETIDTINHDLEYLDFLNFKFGFNDDNSTNFISHEKQQTPQNLLNFTLNTFKRIIKKLYYDSIKIILKNLLFQKTYLAFTCLGHHFIRNKRFSGKTPDEIAMNIYKLIYEKKKIKYLKFTMQMNMKNYEYLGVFKKDVFYVKRI